MSTFSCSEDDILKELEELSLETQGGKAKVTPTACLYKCSKSYLSLVWQFLTPTPLSTSEDRCHRGNGDHRASKTREEEN